MEYSINGSELNAMKSERLENFDQIYLIFFEWKTYKRANRLFERIEIVWRFYRERRKERDK